MYVQNATLGSGLTQEGTWTVPGASGPAPVSVTPSSGSGSSQTFAFMFSDPAGAADINSAQIIINSSLATTNGCYFYLYASGSNVLYLANDAGAFQSSLPVGATGTLQNSQCSVNVGASSVMSSGTTFTLNLALSFTPAFAGSKNIYMYVQNATVGKRLTQEGPGRCRVQRTSAGFGHAQQRERLLADLRLCILRPGRRGRHHLGPDHHQHFDGDNK